MRGIAERIADIYFPLMRKAVTKLFDEQYSSQLIDSFNCPPSLALVNLVRDELKKAFEQVPKELRNMAERELFAFQSPSYRRRRRQQEWQRILPTLDVQGSFIRGVQEQLRESGKEHEAEFKKVQIETSRPPAINDIEQRVVMEGNHLAQTLAANPKLVDILFPLKETIGNPAMKYVYTEVGTEGYRNEVAGLVSEFFSNRQALSDEIRDASSKRKKVICQVLGLDLTELDKLQRFDPNQAVISFFKLLLYSIMADVKRCDTNKATKLSRIIAESLLVPRILGTRSAGPYSRGREVSLQTSIGDGITMEDALPDDKAGNETAHIENRVDLEILLKDLPAAQRRSAEVYLEHIQTGTPIQGICKRDGDNYQAVRQAFQRLKKHHRH